jgi:hypothetical protein
LSDNENRFKNNIERNTVIQIVVFSIAFILLMRVYPFGVVQSYSTSRHQNSVISASSYEFTNLDKKLQCVYFMDNHIYEIKLYMDVAVNEHVSSAQIVTFKLYDENFSCIYSEDFSLYKIAKKGYLKAKPDMDVTQGLAYYYEIIVSENCMAHIELPLASIDELSQEENAHIFIDGIYDDTQSLVADFIYSSPLSLMAIIFRYIVIIAIAILIYVVIIYCLGLYDARFAQYNKSVRKIIKIVATLAVTLFGIYVIIYSVVLNRFKASLQDRSVYVFAAIAGIFYCLGALWISGNHLKAKRDYSRPLIWKNYIQSISFGFLFYALCQYVNAQREYTHTVNTRWMLIFLAVAFLMILNGSIIVNKFSGAWLVVGWICSAIYCNGFKDSVEDYTVARLTCGVIVAWGLFLLNLIISYGKQGIKYKISKAKIGFYIRKNKFQTLFVTMWVLFALLMYVYRFEKTWVFTATLPFVSLFVMKLTPQLKNRLLKNFTNGIILSFLLVTFYSLQYRPYNYWISYRYGGMFHTVATTGMYLSVVYGALLGKIYGHIKDKRSIFTTCYFEIFLLGCVTIYIIMTMSRTAFMAVGACTVLVALLAAYVYKKGIKRIIQELGILLATVIVCFPLVFSATRIIPAIVNEPVVYDVETHDDVWNVNVGEPIYSSNYMTIERFLNLFFNRFSIAMSDNDENKTLLAYNSNMIGNVIQNPQYTENGNTYELSKDEDEDGSNGRFEIFLAYIHGLRLSGHPGMEAEEGLSYGHAHNSYLQVFFNFGIIAGVVFLILCFLTLLKSVDMVKKNARKYSIYFVPVAIIVVFGVLGLTEWSFHPCIPAGFAYLFVQAVLLKD